MTTDHKKLNHYETLKEKHEMLDKKIVEAFNHHDNDESIRKLKIKKLHVKEELERLKKEMKA